MSEIERHLHQMTQLLRQEDSIKLVVRLESIFSSRIRYLAVVSCMEQESDAEEYCLLGIDCQGHISLGLVLAILSHTTIRLDGDGGFCITNGDGLRSHIFKPVSVQTMWSALQSLYRASECAKKNNSYQVCAVKHYECLFQANKSDPACLNEWNTLPGVETRRPLNSSMSSDEISFQVRISSSLREILLSERDLDEVTSKEIRTKLEYKLQVDLSTYKSFIDEEMLKILGQMEAPARILEHLYLGTEWNASHQQDLFDKEIGYVLNVTAEIDNFFPDTFRYMNIPVCDNEDTDLLRFFNDSYRFISEALKEGKNVLVHCKMGISRSATIVIAYVMKNRNWDLLRSIEHVKQRRTCVKPNPNFMKQLEVYEGILAAKRYSNTLEKRSKSESNLKQSDLSLSTSKDVNLSSSNDNLRRSKILKTTSRKYYNTAPARLKPEKHPKILISLSRPKSCSCAAIAITEEKRTFSRVDDLFPRDVMDSFQDAVESLEQSSALHSPLNICELAIQSEVYSSSFNNYGGSLTGSSSSLPVVIANKEPTSNFISTETLFLSSSGYNNTCTPQICENNVTLWEPLVEEASSSVSIVCLSECLTTAGSDEKTKDLIEEVDPICADSERTNAKTNLKCCRRPFNGHTFSVSPNQVVNISSGVDLSKFSVRHLVNEFELQSNRNIHSSLGGSIESSSSGFPSSSAIFDLTCNASLSISRRKSWTPFDSPKEYNTRKENKESNADHSLEKDEISSWSLNDQSMLSGDLQLVSIRNCCEVQTLKKEGKMGCVPFFRRHLNSGSGHKSDRSDKEMATTTIGKLLKSHSKKSSETSRSREKIKDRGTKNRGKMDQSSESEDGLMGETIDRTEEGNANFSSLVYQSTGVVKQRLEAFEAKAVSASDRKYNNRSHNRSFSATGPTSAVMLCPLEAVDKCSYGHRRKSSMPHLNSGTLEFESPSCLTHHVPFEHLSERKGSLDSSTLLKSIPSVNNRPFTVRGFQSTASSSSKSPFTATRLRGNNIGYNTSTLGIRQQHGSTHPLKLLPKTTKLT